MKHHALGPQNVASHPMGWLACGVLDGLSAIAITLLFGGKVIRTFQGIAGGG